MPSLTQTLSFRPLVLSFLLLLLLLFFNFISIFFHSLTQGAQPVPGRDPIPSFPSPVSLMNLSRQKRSEVTVRAVSGRVAGHPLKSWAAFCLVSSEADAMETAVRKWQGLKILFFPSFFLSSVSVCCFPPLLAVHRLFVWLKCQGVTRLYKERV